VKANEINGCTKKKRECDERKNKSVKQASNASTHLTHFTFFFSLILQILQRIHFYYGEHVPYRAERMDDFRPAMHDDPLGKNSF
jgi:hypothetical protein